MHTNNNVSIQLKLQQQNQESQNMQGYNNCDHIYSFGEDPKIGSLWLGDYSSSKNRRIHREKNISTVITAGLGMKISLSDPIKHRLYPLYDCPSQNIQKYFPQSFEHIETGLQNGNVLVHCFAGVSRSSTIIISYLMKKLSWTFRQALDHVRKKRWVINPNPGFIRQLKRYEAKLLNGVNNPETEKQRPNFYSTALKNSKPKQFSSRPYESAITNKNAGRGVSVIPAKKNDRSLNYSLGRK